MVIEVVKVLVMSAATTPSPNVCPTVKESPSVGTEVGKLPAFRRIKYPLALVKELRDEKLKSTELKELAEAEKLLG